MSTQQEEQFEKNRDIENQFAKKVKMLQQRVLSEGPKSSANQELEALGLRIREFLIVTYHK